MTENRTKIIASIVILTKNPGAIFKKVLPKALSQKTDWPFEVIVIDSGSKDGTLEFCRQFPQLKLYEIPALEFGHGKTRNYGIELAQGEYVAMLTHDALPKDNFWLKNLIKPLIEEPKAAGVFGRHEAYDTANPCIKRELIRHFDTQLQLGKFVSLQSAEKKNFQEKHKRNLHFFSDNNACLRKSIWKKIPYPNVEFMEDQVWAALIIKAGYIKAYADDAIVYHSHDYTPLQILRRQFDESYFFKEYFGYVLTPTWLRMLKLAFGRTGLNVLYLCSLKSFSNLPWILKEPALNFCRALGSYLGGRGHKMSSKWFEKLSSTKKLQGE